MKKMNVRFAVLFVLISMSFGCDSNSKEASLESVEITQLVQFGENLITDSPKRISVVRNQEQFEIEWPRISSEQIPELDFDGVYVVIAEMGYQSSGRGNIEISEVLSSEKYSEVHVVTSVVGSNCQVTLALNSPFHMISFPRSGIDVIIKEEYVVNDC